MQPNPTTIALLALFVILIAAGNVSYLGTPEVARQINGLGEVRQR